MPTTSYLPSFEVPKDDIWAFLFERKDRLYPDDKVLYSDPFNKRSYTYTQLKSAAEEFGKGLKSAWEWEKGDVLALYTPNCIDSPAVIFGCLWAGGIVSPANPGYTVDELAFQLQDSGAKALATQLSCLEVALAAARLAGIADERVILLGDEKDQSYKFKHFTSIRNLAGTSRYRRTRRDPEDTAYLPYSSGTTGKPKGVILCHRNITSNVLMMQPTEMEHLNWRNDKLIGFLPFFHIYGLTLLIQMCLYNGLEVVVLPKYDLQTFCRVIQDCKITMLYLVPPVLLQLSKDPIVANYDLGSLRMMNSAAAPLTEDLVHAVYKRLKIPVKQAYGLSETSPATHTQPWSRWQTNIGSIGVLLPNQTCKIMSPDEKEMPLGDVGELWVKGPNVFKGYLNNSNGTANALTSDGYFKTGDIGYEDEAGNFYITDRVKELIKYKGFQVPPAELEGKLLGHENINDAAVIGIYDAQQATEVPRAYVVVKQGIPRTSQTGDEIVRWIHGKVANHKRLRGGVRFVDEIPKSASGKLLRRVLKDSALKEEGGKARL